MNLRDRLSLEYTRQLASHPTGRAYVLNQLADAEETGEADIFDRALAHVDDPQLTRMIEKHRADEIRHAGLFRACLARTGVTMGPVPAHLRVMDRLDRALGGFLTRPIANARGVMEAYLVLQVVEERAMHQFPIVAQAFAPYDPETVAVLEEVSRDEERHLKYCQAIARRYAPDTATLVSTLRYYRDVEARCFRDNSDANMDYTLDEGLMHNAAVRVAWRAVGAVARRVPALPYTPFAQNFPSDRVTSTQATASAAAA